MRSLAAKKTKTSKPAATRATKGAEKSGKKPVAPAPKKPTKPAAPAKPAKGATKKPVKAPASKPSKAEETRKVPAAAKSTQRFEAPAPGKQIPRMPPGPSKPLTPPRSVAPPTAPIQIPMPPRPPGPPLLRKITHLESAKNPPKLVLKLGDRAVKPKHGVAEVIAIQTLELGGSKGDFYVLRLLDDPTKKLFARVGETGDLRAIMTPKEAEQVIETMKAKEVAVNEHPWSRRFRAYTEMINSGSPYEIAKVMRDMYRLKFDKDLSFGERRLLDQARSLLMKELAFAKKVPEEELHAEVAKIFDLPPAAPAVVPN